MITLEKIRNEIEEIRENGCMSSECVKDLVMLYWLEDKLEEPEEYHEHHRHDDRAGKHLDRETAEKWVGMIGESYTMEQTTKAMHARKLHCDPVEYWVIVNAMRSDYPKLAAKYGVDHMDFFADMAVEWLEDEDAKPGKAGNYWKCVVNHE